MANLTGLLKPFCKVVTIIKPVRFMRYFKVNIRLVVKIVIPLR